MKGQITAIIILIIAALIFTIWTLIDENYYLSLFGLFIIGSQLYQLKNIKKKK